MKLHLPPWLAILLACILPHFISAQVPVLLTASTNTFETAPLVNHWTTRAVAGALGDVTTAAQLDAQVQAVAATTVVDAVASVPGTAPPVWALARHASDLGALINRTTSTRFTVLMATLKNDSGQPLSGVQLRCNFSVITPSIEQVPGLRVFYSVTGASNSWILIPEFSGVDSTVTRTVSIHLNLWPTNANLYVLFADDNAASGETGYLLDDFVTLGIPAGPQIVQPPQEQAISPGGSANFSVSATGTLPFFYQWYADGEPIQGATNNLLSIESVSLPDVGQYSVLVSNAYGFALSPGALLSVGCFQMPTLNSQPETRILLSGGTTILSAAATGTLPISFQWFRGQTLLSGATNATLVLSNVLPSDTGVYVLRAQNCAGSAFSTSTIVSVTPPQQVIFGMTNHLWRYQQDGVDLGTSWRAADFDDGAWPQGRGLFAQENQPVINLLTNTVLTLTPIGSSVQNITFYFRTRFLLTNELHGIALVISNYIDDGAVVYLNGVEAWRYNMPAGPIGYSSLANAANPLGEGVAITTNLPGELLIQGENVIAVEVHQNSAISSDVAFGLEARVQYIPPTQLSITNQPSDQTAAQSSPVTLSIGVAGGAPHFRWYRNGQLLAGSGASLVISSAQPADAGFYWVVASNSINVVTSRVASLVVLADSTPPFLLSADWIDATHVLAAFSEPLSTGIATNIARYQITNTFGTSVAIVSAVVTNATNVLVTVAPSPIANCVLTVNGITDASPQTNVLLSEAWPIARTWPLVRFDSQWDYFSPMLLIGESYPAPQWKNPEYDISLWGNGAGAFVLSTDGSAASSIPAQTQLFQTDAASTFFRSDFSLSASPGGLSCWLRHAVDDGAVFHLNGLEVARFNMAPGPVAPTQLAVVDVVGPELSSPITIDPAALRTGTNHIAVELHASAHYPDQLFLAAELTVRAESLLVGPLLIVREPKDTVVTEGSIATFHVSAVAARTFQWQVNGVDWPGATNAVFELHAPLALHGAQICCRVGADHTSVRTSEAILYVLPDLTPPVLLSAEFTSNGSVLLAFSEPLDPLTATNTANYALTNAIGSGVIEHATLVNGTNVLLTLSVSNVPGNYTVVINNVTDASVQGNSVHPGTAARITARYALGFESAWKYLLINTNAMVQFTFMQPGYDDSMWLGPSNGLFYVETASLAAAKNTPLVLQTPNAEVINTYYFRTRVYAPQAGYPWLMKLRHITDDAMALHLNGVEIYRYNLPAGPITAGTQAAANIGDATIVGPINILLTNFVAGTNLFAVEVHQQGFSSVDVVMGVEIEIEMPGEVFPPATEPLPRLGMTAVGPLLVLHWQAGNILETAPNLTGPWLPLTTVSPHYVSPTNASAFFRLRR